MTVSSAYFDSACMGQIHPLITQTARKIVDDFAAFQGDSTEFTCAMYEKYRKGHLVAEKALSLECGSVAFVENTSHGLGLIANALPIKREHNILICDLEFFSTVLCWKRCQKKIGFEIRPVRTSGGCVTVEDFMRAADKNTKVIVVSSVQEINGYRVDISGLASFAHSIGAYLIVDGIQEVGALNPHIVNNQVDVYCAGGHKWLQNPYATGFLYISPRIVEGLEPDFYSYFNAEPPDSGWGRYFESPKRTPFDNLKVTKDATKFETGATINYIGAFCLIESLKNLMASDLDNIEKKVIERRRYLQRRLIDTGLQISGSTQDSALSGICTFNLPGGIQEERKLMNFFAEKQIFCSLRYVSNVGGIRISTPSYTKYEEIDYLIETILKFLH